MKRTIVKKMTLAASIAALYFVLCLVEGNLASGYMANVRLAEGFAVLAFFCPEVILGTTLGCFIYNLAFGFGIVDAAIGTVATFLGGTFILLIGKLFKKDYFKLPLFGIGLVLLNAILVPIVLIVSLPDELNWSMYWLEFGIVAGGEASAVYGVGIPLYYATKSWLPKLLGVNQDIEDDEDISSSKVTD